MSRLNKKIMTISLLFWAVIFLPPLSYAASANYLEGYPPQKAKKQSSLGGQPSVATWSDLPNKLYVSIVDNNNFIKLKDMAHYFWEQQTGAHRDIATNAKHPVKATYSSQYRSQP